MIRVVGNTLTFNSKAYHCAIGRAGIAHKAKEGDGITPLGIFPLRECWYRADLMDAPKTGLPLKVIKQDDGWCDDPKSPDYNKHIKITSPLRGEVDAHASGGGDVSVKYTPSLTIPPQGGRKYSFEKLWRDDGAYDLIVPLGYNDDPVIAGKGSAIFLHLAKPEGTPTEGCVALAKIDLLEILPHLSTATVIEIGQ